jgi:hypothetical protein
MDMITIHPTSYFHHYGHCFFYLRNSIVIDLTMLLICTEPASIAFCPKLSLATSRWPSCSHHYQNLCYCFVLFYFLAVNDGLTVHPFCMLCFLLKNIGPTWILGPAYVRGWRTGVSCGDGMPSISLFLLIIWWWFILSLGGIDELS